jgi:Lrp/AsnC family leucine-responsive transcriptional regulator
VCSPPEAGIIRGYRAVIQPAASGHGLRMIVGVRLGRHSRPEVQAFEKEVVALPEVMQVHHVTGNFDYFLHVEVADLAAYELFH